MSDLKTSIYEGDGTSPGGVVPKDPEPRDMDELLDFVGTETGLMFSVMDYDEMSKHAPPGERWEWEDYQLDYLSCQSNYASNKARQVGMSAAFAAKAFARGILTQNRNYTAIFTSYKKEEAVNKVNYVKQFLEALPPRFRKKIVRDPQQLIEWENRDGTRCKIISHAQRPIRGAHGDIFLDELAFYQFADEIYESAFAATEMMGGTIDVVSTPFGKFGKFYDIITDEVTYPDYYRDWIYWWNCKRYLKHPTDEFKYWAKANAPSYGDDLEGVRRRVEEFGNGKIKRLFRNLADLDSFRQELEGHFVDKEASFFSRDLIMESMFPTEESLIDDYAPKEDDFNIPVEEALADRTWPIVEKYGDVNLRTYESINELLAAVAKGDVSDNLIGGADIGTTHHGTEFVVLEEIRFSSGETLHVERFHMTKHDWDLPDQQKWFDHILRKGFLQKLRMDCTGVGHQMGQALSRSHSDCFVALQMGGSSQKQEVEMANLRARMENTAIALSYDREKISQLHSIRRVITDSKNISYKASEKGRHHADYAWALAFASRAGTIFGQEPIQFTMSNFGEFRVGMKESLGNEAEFVDDFNSSYMKPGKANNFDFGSSLGTGIKENIALRSAQPGKFIDNHHEG